MQASRASIAERVKKAGLNAATAHATWLDDGVAAVMQKLEALGLADNTAIVFMSDNGTLQGKATCYEGGAHVPAFIRWKGHVPAGVNCDRLVANLDFVPTILDICGVKPPPAMKLDGASVLPLIAGKNSAWREALLLEVGHSRAIVTGKWKYLLVRYPPSLQEKIADGTLGRKPFHGDTVFALHKVAEKAHPAYFDLDQLYDLEKDPGEKINLAKAPEHSRKVAELSAQLKSFCPKSRARSVSLSELLITPNSSGTCTVVRLLACEHAQYFLIIGLREGVVVSPYCVKVRIHPHHLDGVSNSLEPSHRADGSDWSRNNHSRGVAAAGRLNCRFGGRPRCEAIIDEQDNLSGQVLRTPMVKATLVSGQTLQFLFNHRVEGLTVDAGPSDNRLVQDDHAVFGKRADCELTEGGVADFSNDQHVERQVQFLSDTAGHNHTAPG